MSKNTAKYFHIDTSKLPLMIIFKLNHGHNDKHLLDKAITEENIK